MFHYKNEVYFNIVLTLTLMDTKTFYEQFQFCIKSKKKKSTYLLQVEASNKKLTLTSVLNFIWILDITLGKILNFLASVSSSEK